MDFHKILTQKREAIVERWFQLILQTYPKQTQRFLRNEKDPFANPVGTTVLREIDFLFGGLLGENDASEISSAIEKIIRIRAVENLSPSEAVIFLFLLKRAVRLELKEEITLFRPFEELLALESRIDDLALTAFEKYMKCREKIHEIRINEIKRASYRLIEKGDSAVRRTADLDGFEMNPAHDLARLRGGTGK